ncbi:MAG: phosphonate ABC transporter ATP-binding protein [Truepera sp.]|nr:phosphonate ABC transporter ATP-binding protein [Truepera sp.]
MGHINFENVEVVYKTGLKALKGVTLDIPRGQFVVVVGLSGAGKSTLIRTVNSLVLPSSGRVVVDGTDVTSARGRALRRARSDIGMIFQTFNLVKRSSVIRNVLAGRLGSLPAWRGVLSAFPREDLAYAHDCLDRVGIPEKAYVRADALSGGQQQRVGIARALAQNPSVMLADEPVASLDPPTSHAVMSDLKRISREDGITTVVNLHFIDMARDYADRIIGMRDGLVVFDGTPDEATDASFEEIYGRPIDDKDLRGG